VVTAAILALDSIKFHRFGLAGREPLLPDLTMPWRVG